MKIREASLISLAIVAINLAASYLLGWPLLTDRIAEWIMARTPNTASVWILGTLGDWAKPAAATGGLATIGALCWVLVHAFRIPAFSSARRGFLTQTVMLGGTVGVAAESYLRNQALARGAESPRELFPHVPPPDQFAPELVRKNITPVGQFYVMSKNTVDPALSPRDWRLKITAAGKLLREVSYAELLSLPQQRRYQTLRCISNTLKSDLMGTAEWSGVALNQLVSPRDLPEGIMEMAVIGVDGHGDSFPVNYAWTDEPMLAAGMNGRSLNRQHGFPLRLLVPRYYGFKNIKWIGEIAFVREPYFGTWPKMGYTKEPVIHTCSFVDRVRRSGARLQVGGASFAGVRGIQRVEVRSGGGASWSPWSAAKLESPLSPYALTRWKAELEPPSGAEFIEARAQDGVGAWQAATERPLFPDGMAGPTLRRIPS